MGDLINGRTPEEIERGLGWIAHKCDFDGEGCNECEFLKECHTTVEEDVAKDALTLIERLESERDAALAKVPKWISVKERLPEKAGRYLVCAVNRYGGDGQIIAAYYQFGARFHLVDLYEVTHWMPLPEPPEEETYETTD